MYYSNLLSQIPFIDHCFFSRNGGYSSGYFQSLNTSYRVGDEKENVDKNLNVIKNHLGCNNLSYLKQSHTTEYHEILNSQENTSEIEKDALITKLPNVILAAQTADCIPILMVNTETKEIASVHCGWKGLVFGIIQNVLDKLKQNSNISNIVVAIGPCIHQESYEVDEEFYKNRIIEDKESESFFKKHENSYLFSINNYAKHILVREGIKPSNLEDIELNTFEMEENFFSHRRHTKRNEPARGIQMSCILIK